jgi:uncharacterized protein Veg
VIDLIFTRFQIHKELKMIDAKKEIDMHVGDRVVPESTVSRRFSRSNPPDRQWQLVENYKGASDRIVVTIQLGDAVVNKRDSKVTPLMKFNKRLQSTPSRR